MAHFRSFFSVICLFGLSSRSARGEIFRAFKDGDAIIGGLLTMHREATETGCSPTFLPGINRVEAAIFAIEQINNDLNILPNVTIGYDIRDICNDRGKAMEHTYDFSTNFHLQRGNSEHFVNQNANSTCTECLQCSKLDTTVKPIAAVVGPYGSRNSLQVAGLLQVVSIPAISPSATSEELSWAFYRKFFRTVSPDNFQARAMADLIDYFGWEYIAVIAVEHSYGLYGFRALENESLQRKTFCIGLVEYITPTRYEHRLRPIVEKIKRAENIKVVVLWIGDTIASDLTKEAHAQNLKERVWIMSDSLATKTPEFLGSDLMSLGTYLGVQPRQFHYLEYENYVKNVTPKINKSKGDRNPWFDFLWREEFNCSTNNKTPGYEQCSDDLKISNELYQKMSDDFIPYQVDAIYAIAHVLDKIYRCQEPFGLLAGGKCPQKYPFVSSSDVLLYLRNVSFEGITGRVEFNDYGDPLQAAYDIVSFQKAVVDRTADGKHVKIKIGKWDVNSKPELEINESDIIWNYENITFANDTSRVPKSVCREQCPSGTRQTPSVACCWQCIECQGGEVSFHVGSKSCMKCKATERSNINKTTCVPLPIENLEWNSIAGISLTLVTIVGLILTFLTSLIYYKNRRTPVVKAANRELSFLLLFDIAAGFVLPLLTISRPSRLICTVIEPWRYITSSLSVSVLLVKTMKLVKVFQVTYVGKWLKMVCSTTSGQFTSVILLNLIEVILAILWWTLDAPSERTEIEKGKYVLYTCRPYQTTLGLAIDITMVTYLILVSFLCVFYAFRARNLPENFNEARFIGFAMYILLLSWISFYPVKTSLEGWYVAVVSCTTALVSSFGVLGCLYVPKVYVILLHPEQNTKQFLRSELRTANFVDPAPGSVHLSERSVNTEVPQFVDVTDNTTDPPTRPLPHVCNEKP